jgi:hypothetical protein
MGIIEAQGLIKKRAGIMAKIEKPAALACIEDIVTLVDAVMVARGDLGVEIPPEDVPGTQEETVRLCRRVGNVREIQGHFECVASHASASSNEKEYSWSRMPERILPPSARFMM